MTSLPHKHFVYLPPPDGRQIYTTNQGVFMPANLSQADQLLFEALNARREIDLRELSQQYFIEQGNSFAPRDGVTLEGYTRSLEDIEIEYHRNLADLADEIAREQEDKAVSNE